MYIKIGFDRLPNELYLLEFDYLNTIEIFDLFLTLNHQLNNL